MEKLKPIEKKSKTDISGVRGGQRTGYTPFPPVQFNDDGTPLNSETTQMYDIRRYLSRIRRDTSGINHVISNVGKDSLLPTRSGIPLTACRIPIRCTATRSTGRTTSLDWCTDGW
ncbi:hypothetical protein CEXT_185331 [Caerostris extrusa]|uniref:Uncharacterized protein n=1 Tax=Caerostris extrusa TaxID=172846 RepID=A0AAV4NJD4_CAEEX|nr:hypothetical protein CEXT_185331 [Caerostris extrusa]